VLVFLGIYILISSETFKLLGLWNRLLQRTPNLGNSKHWID
jgi:hypothetical protein